MTDCKQVRGCIPRRKRLFSKRLSRTGSTSERNGIRLGTTITQAMPSNTPGEIAAKGILPEIISCNFPGVQLDIVSTDELRWGSVPPSAANLKSTDRCCETKRFRFTTRRNTLAFEDIRMHVRLTEGRIASS